jgi:hypothetical protein
MAAVELVSCCDCSGSNVGDGHAGSSFRADFRGSPRKSEVWRGLEFLWKENDADCASMFAAVDTWVCYVGLQRWRRTSRDAVEYIFFHRSSDLRWRHAHDRFDINCAIRFASR